MVVIHMVMVMRIAMIRRFIGMRAVIYRMIVAMIAMIHRGVIDRRAAILIHAMPAMIVMLVFMLARLGLRLWRLRKRMRANGEDTGD
jgi:hypothetical protein